MRVLLVNCFHYRRGGDSGQFLDLVAQLADRGHDVAVFSMSHPQNLPSEWERYWAPHVDYRDIQTPLARARALARSTYSPVSAHGVTRLIRDFKPQVVHLHSVHHELTLSVVRACASERVPIIWTLHDYRTVCPASTLLRGHAACELCKDGHFWHAVAGRCRSGELKRSVAAAIESYLTRALRSLGRIDCYIAPSTFLAGKVAEMGLPARRIEVVPNPVHDPGLGRSTPDRESLLYVGRLSAEKGVDCLIQAIAGLEGVRLQVLGDGPDSERLRLMSRELGADVEFSGWVDSESVDEHMAKSQLLCFPSVSYENCPGVVLEAMVRGLPVLASDIGGLTELLDSGRAGWFAPPGEPKAWRAAISAFLADESAVPAKVDQAKTRARTRHDPLAFITQIERIYSSLARRP